MKAEATESFGYNTGEIVSSDIIGMRFKFPVRCHADHGPAPCRTAIPGSGRFLVRQRELLHQPDVRTIKYFS